MADEPRVQQLLDEIFDSGCTPEEVCGACPELLPEVRRRWQQICAVEAELDALFPTPGPDLDAETSALWHGGADLPRIPGYDVEELLGRGGMGIVYEAEQESLGRHVALKVLPTPALLDPQHLQRFRREARAAARLHHTNIVPVFGVGEHNGLHYYVMQFIQGQGLDQVLAELHRLRRGMAPGLAQVKTLGQRDSDKE